MNGGEEIILGGGYPGKVVAPANSGNESFRGGRWNDGSIMTDGGGGEAAS